jgi:Fe-S-cluster containining protein
MRQGDCTPNCGACCKFIILNVNPSYLKDKAWIEAHGIKVFEQDGGVWIRINAACNHLTEDNQCGIYGKPERFESCSLFPTVQSDIDLVNEEAGEAVCSYSFSSAAQEK